VIEFFVYLVVKLNFHAFKHKGIDLRKEDKNYLIIYIVATLGLYAKIYTYFGFTSLTIDYLYTEINNIEDTSLYLKLIYIQFTGILATILNAGFIFQIIGTTMLFMWILNLFSRYNFKLLYLWGEYINHLLKKIKYNF
jgi:hypothetical protein